MSKQFTDNENVYLKERYRSASGNVYYPGTYKARELPKAIRTDRFLGTQVISRSYNNAITVNKVNIEAQKESTKKLNPPREKKESNNLEINTATVEELGNLTNVGIAIANKIVEERQKQAFADVEDLTARVRLNKGSWDSVGKNLLFS